jgi:hypothetical protein
VTDEDSIDEVRRHVDRFSEKISALCQEEAAMGRGARISFDPTYLEMQRNWAEKMYERERIVLEECRVAAVEQHALSIRAPRIEAIISSTRRIVPSLTNRFPDAGVRASFKLNHGPARAVCCGSNLTCDEFWMKHYR